MSARKERLRVAVGLTIAIAAFGTLAASPRAPETARKPATQPVVAKGAPAVRPTPTPSPAAAVEAGEPTEVTPGMRAFKDAKTGRLRQPEQEELRQLAIRAARGKGTRKLRALDAGGEGLQNLEGPDGAVGIALDESYMAELIATVGPDGKVRLRHVDGLEAGEARTRAGVSGAQGDRNDR